MMLITCGVFGVALPTVCELSPDFDAAAALGFYTLASARYSRMIMILITCGVFGTALTTACEVFGGMLT